MSSTEFEDDVVRHKHRAEIGPGPSVRIMDLFVRQKNDCVERRFANPLEKCAGIDALQITGQSDSRKSKLPQHEPGKELVPSAQTKPASRTVGSVAHHMDMHVDPTRRRRSLASDHGYHPRAKWYKQ